MKRTYQTNMASKKMATEKGVGLYSLALISRKIALPFNVVDAYVKRTLNEKIVQEVEGKCLEEGFVKPNSVRIESYSSGTFDGNKVVFNTVFECLVCNPPEGMQIKVIVRNVSKAGVRAEMDIDVSPVVVYIMRDHHNMNDKFLNLKPGDSVSISIIGKRYELNDEYVSIIGKLL